MPILPLGTPMANCDRVGKAKMQAAYGAHQRAAFDGFFPVTSCRSQLICGLFLRVAQRRVERFQRLARGAQGIQAP